jgi:hypothetical protein
MKTLTIAIAAVAIMAFPAVASAAACRDTHGHFMKCPPKHAVASMRHAPCRDNHGRFKKC